MHDKAQKTSSEKEKPEDSSEPIRAAVRFPLKLSLSLRTPQGDVQATTENVSATGVLFVTDLPLEMDTRVEFKLAIPASVLGTATDVTVQCTGHVVRQERTDDDRRAAAVVIDKYTFEA
ncbi:MAG TPA: PilZ domain-containing protein [Acidobacteriaceae bacterium]|jgi:hypothetical protein|nr:PilZ domain-containing protein [Acidobacteriaceae bacterium]